MDRVRMLKRGVKGKNIGKFFSVKMNIMLWFESLLEESMMYLLDFDPDVRWFKEQPCRIRYMHGVKAHRYTPDLLIVRRNETQIVEIKPKEKVETEKFNLLFHTVSSICERAGYGFKVFTEETILQQPRLNNIKALWSYARTPLYPQHQIYCQEFLYRAHSICLSEIIKLFQAKGVPKQAVYALLFWGALDFDLTEPISPNSRIYLPGSRADRAREVQ